MFATLVGPSSSREDALIRFRREWRHPELIELELLSALTYCYAFLQGLLLDGHRLLESSLKEECSFHQALVRTNERLPRYMQERASSGSAWYVPKDRSVTSIRLSADRLDRKTASEIVRARYGEFNPGERGEYDVKDMLGRCNFFMKMGQHMLKRDEGLVMFFFIEGDGIFVPCGFQPRDRAEKHVLVREVADFVLLHRAEMVTCISEIWTADYDPNKPVVHAIDSPDRREAIAVDSVNRNGETVSLICEFTRGESGIECGEIRNMEGMITNFLEPIRKAFRKL
jgi:hypothetical protein